MIYKTHDSILDINKLHKVVEELIASIEKANDDLRDEMQNFGVDDLMLRINDSAKKIKNNEQVIDDLVKEVSAIDIEEFNEIKDYITNIKTALENDKNADKSGRYAEKCRELSDALIETNDGASVLFSKTGEILENVRSLNDQQLNSNEELLNESRIVGDYSGKINGILDDYIARNNRVLCELLKINEVINDVSQKCIHENKELKRETIDMNKSVSKKDAEITELKLSQIKLYQEKSKSEEKVLTLRSEKDALNESVCKLKLELSTERKRVVDLTERLDEKIIYIDELNKTIQENSPVDKRNELDQELVNILPFNDTDGNIVSTIHHADNTNCGDVFGDLDDIIVNMGHERINVEGRKSVRQDILESEVDGNNYDYFLEKRNLNCAVVDIDCESEDDYSKLEITAINNNIEKTIVDALDTILSDKKPVDVPELIASRINKIRDVINEYKESSVILEGEKKDLFMKVENFEKNVQSMNRSKLFEAEQRKTIRAAKEENEELIEDLNNLKQSYDQLTKEKEKIENELLKNKSKLKKLSIVSQVVSANTKDSNIYNELRQRIDELQLENVELKQKLGKNKRKRRYSLDEIENNDKHTDFHDISVPENIEKHRKVMKNIAFLTDNDIDSESDFKYKNKLTQSNLVVNVIDIDSPKKINNQTMILPEIVDVCETDSTNDNSSELINTNAFENSIISANILYIIIGSGLLTTIFSFIYSIEKEKVYVDEYEDDEDN